jgi:hypothetical protein
MRTTTADFVVAVKSILYLEELWCSYLISLTRWERQRSS